MTDFLRKTTYSYASNGHSTTKYDIRRHHCEGKINPYCWRETAWIFSKNHPNRQNRKSGSYAKWHGKYNFVDRIDFPSRGHKEHMDQTFCTPVAQNKNFEFGV